MFQTQISTEVPHTSTGDINVPLDFEGKPDPDYAEKERITYLRDGLRYDGEIECAAWKNPRHTVTGWYYRVLADGRHVSHWIAQDSIITSLGALQ